MKKAIIIILSCCIFQSCDVLQLPSKTTTTNTSTKPTSSTTFSGKASYYHDKFQGRSTASGEKYDKNKLTAAHKTLAFGTKVEVTNLKNNKKVIVKINDRLPSSSSRSIDLSRAAAKQINMITDGVVNVKIKVLN